MRLMRYRLGLEAALQPFDVFQIFQLLHLRRKVIAIKTRHQPPLALLTRGSFRGFSTRIPLDMRLSFLATARLCPFKRRL